MADELFLILGCWGRVESDFVSCKAIENSILKIDDHLEFYNEMMNYLDNCRLFDRPTFDLNSVRNIISYLQDKFVETTKQLWKPNKYSIIHKFINDHRHCGVYLKLELIPLEKTAEKEKQPLKVIQGSKK